MSSATACWRRPSATADGSTRSGGRSRLCSKMARARGFATGEATLYTDNFPWNVKSAQVFIFNMRQLDIEVGPLQLPGMQERPTPGEPWDIAGVAIHAAYPDPAGVFVPPSAACALRGAGRRSNWPHGIRSGPAWPISRLISCATTRPSRHGDWRLLFFVSRSFGCWDSSSASRPSA